MLAITATLNLWFCSHNRHNLQLLLIVDRSPVSATAAACSGHCRRQQVDRTGSYIELSSVSLFRSSLKLGTKMCCGLFEGDVMVGLDGLGIAILETFSHALTCGASSHWVRSSNIPQLLDEPPFAIHNC
jgi:hypothetical protein